MDRSMKEALASAKSAAGAPYKKLWWYEVRVGKRTIRSRDLLRLKIMRNYAVLHLFYNNDTSGLTLRMRVFEGRVLELRMMLLGEKYEDIITELEGAYELMFGDDA